MTRKQRMYPESNRVKMSLYQDNLVENIHRTTKKVFVKKAGKRDYSDTEYDDRRIKAVKIDCDSVNASENLHTPKAEQLDEGQLYEWNTKQFIIQL